MKYLKLFNESRLNESLDYHELFNKFDIKDGFGQEFGGKRNSTRLIKTSKNLSEMDNFLKVLKTLDIMKGEGYEVRVDQTFGKTDKWPKDAKEHEQEYYWHEYVNIFMVIKDKPNDVMLQKNFDPEYWETSDGVEKVHFGGEYKSVLRDRYNEIYDKL